MPLPLNTIPPQGDDTELFAKKRLFIGLILGSSALVCLFLVLLWVVPYVGLSNIHPAASWILGVLVAGAVGLVSWASLGLVLNILTGRTLPYFRKLRGLTVKFFLPLMTLLGRALGLPKERVRSSFIKVNNELVSSELRAYKPSEILMLMPHCLQKSDCDMRLTYDVDNCKRCGKCPIAGLLALRDKYGASLTVATGGTIARRVVVQKRPKLIVAVACERDLASGIQDVFPLPVYGVLNERPHGPCLDTQVTLPRLEEALRRFITPEALAEIDAAEARRAAEREARKAARSQAAN